MLSRISNAGNCFLSRKHLAVQLAYLSSDNNIQLVNSGHGG